MTDGGFTVPEAVVESLVASVTKMRSMMFVTEEMLVDLGHPPPPGYWERQLARNIAAARYRWSLRYFWVRLRWFEPVHRLTHAIAALRGHDHEEGDR